MEAPGPFRLLLFKIQQGHVEKNWLGGSRAIGFNMEIYGKLAQRLQGHFAWLSSMDRIRKCMGKCLGSSRTILNSVLLRI